MCDYTECSVCSDVAVDEEANLITLASMELDMATKTPQDEGIYEPMVTKTWLSEMKQLELFGWLAEETEKYYPPDHEDNA